MSTRRHALRSETGLGRPSNQDATPAGGAVRAAADGFGPRGEVASSGAVGALAGIDLAGVLAGELLNHLYDTAARAGAAAPAESGTTLTALAWTGS